MLQADTSVAVVAAMYHTTRILRANPNITPRIQRNCISIVEVLPSLSHYVTAYHKTFTTRGTEVRFGFRSFIAIILSLL